MQGKNNRQSQGSGNIPDNTAGAVGRQFPRESSRIRGQQQGQEFESSEPELQEQPQGIEQPGRDTHTGKIQRSGMSNLPDEIKDKLAAFDDMYHDYHSGTRPGSKVNPLYDIRLTPQKRLERYLDSKWNEFGDDIEAAVNYAIQEFEKQGEGIAGKWADNYQERQQEQDQSAEDNGR